MTKSKIDSELPLLRSTVIVTGSLRVILHGNQDLGLTDRRMEKILISTNQKRETNKCKDCFVIFSLKVICHLNRFSSLLFFGRPLGYWHVHFIARRRRVLF